MTEVLSLVLFTVLYKLVGSVNAKPKKLQFNECLFVLLFIMLCGLNLL